MINKRNIFSSISFIILFGFCRLSIAQTYHVLCYHDVYQKISNVSEDTLARAYAFNDLNFVSTNYDGRHTSDGIEISNLKNQFAWLKNNGYNVITVDDIIKAKSGKKSLPEKSVLITFDDGYQSFYKYVFPLLKLFNYNAVLAIEGRWIATPQDQDVLYGNERIPRSEFLSISEIKELSNSGLVEIASHTWDMHKGVLGNPQGNEMPAVTTRIYDPISNTYEADQPYASRLKNDFHKNNRFISSMTQTPVRVMVWPFGSYNGFSEEIATSLGLNISMTLDEGVNTTDQSLHGIKRLYITGNPKLSEFVRLLERPEKPIVRVVHVDLDYIYDPDPIQQNNNLGLLLERINTLGANTVFLQAFSDDDARGEARSLYFPNRHLPMKSDLFSRVSWQLRTRTSARNIYAWMPLLAFIPQDNDWAQNNSVVASNDQPGIGYQRLSPFSNVAREYIAEIYEDLAKNAYISGILIHDDATLSDFEDDSTLARQYYQSRGFAASVSEIRSDPIQFGKWSKLKTDTLSDLSRYLKARAERYRKPIKLARNYYAGPILNKSAEDWFAQSYEDGLKNFDWVAIMAMPYFEKSESPKKWLNELIAAVKSVPNASEKTIFELQAKDWERNIPITNKELSSWMRMLRVQGMNNFGYYPDDPFKNHPDIKVIRKEFSTKYVMED